MAIDELFAEWRQKRLAVRAFLDGRAPSIVGRDDVDIAKDILSLAGEDRRGRIILRDDLVGHPIIDEIMRRIMFADGIIRGVYGFHRRDAAHPTWIARWADLPGVD